MAITVKLLKNGVLTTTAGADLYPVSSGKSAIVKSIRLVNKSGSPVTVNLFVYNNGNTTTTRIFPVALSLPAGALVVDSDEITLGALDKITGDASAGSAVDYTISGIERDV